jgi:hypothetical protein
MTCANLFRAMDEVVAVVRALPERDQRLLRAEMLERAAEDILNFYDVEARPESIQ